MGESPIPDGQRHTWGRNLPCGYLFINGRGELELDYKPIPNPLLVLRELRTAMADDQRRRALSDHWNQRMAEALLARVAPGSDLTMEADHA